MNESSRYQEFGLVRDMLATADVIRQFDAGRPAAIASGIAGVGNLLMTGEGSSRLFPAKHAIAHSRRKGWPLTLHTEGGRQAQEYALDKWAVLAASNSGRTAEVIELFNKLTGAGHQHLYSLTAFADSKLESLAQQGFVLSCGEEGAVAATKSVVEQALFCRALLESVAGEEELQPLLAALGDAFQSTLEYEIEASIIDRIASAGVIYWAGRNDGVAEELTLKTNEITRKASVYLEGTYAVHGVEEVMEAGDVVIWIDPDPVAEDKFHQVLVEGASMEVIAISSRETRFPTIQVPDQGALAPFVQMAAGWNILVETGIKLGVDLDKPVRARKVGNEFAG